MEQTILSAATKLFPFYGIAPKTVDVILSGINCRIESFAKRDVILSPNTHEAKVGFILDGECKVSRQRSDGEPLPLNTLPRYSSFGILSVFSSEEEFPTVITASKPTKVLFISSDDMIYITKKYHEIAMNVITFLAGRISFLNSKVATFSEKSTLQKLVNYILSKYRLQGDTIKASKTDISSEISVGRASLYRDLAILEEEGLIKVETKKIIIINPEGLERKNL